MTISVNCSCGRTLKLADEHAGKKVRCPQCSSPVLIKSSSPKLRKTASAGRSRPKAKSRKKKRASSKSRTLSAKAPLIAGGVLAAVVVIAMGYSVIKSFTTGAPDSGNPAIAETPSQGTAAIARADAVGSAEAQPAATNFPPRPAFQPAFPSGVSLGRVRLAGNGPAQQTQMNVYLPAGNHESKSLGCVLVAPAGTNLLMGNSLDGDDYHDETLPYAEAGFVTIQYSLDGSVANLESASNAQMAAAYKQFRSAEAGMLNVRTVIEFVKARLPEVDPARIFTAGHSSAGTVSLLAGQNFPELAGCIAYAPCSDPEAFHAEFSSVAGINSVFPGLNDFDRQYSPARHTQKLKCPLFVFQARDDSVVEAKESRRFVDLMKQHNQRVQYAEVGSGGHYQSMIDEGIPRGVQWLTQLNESRSAAE